MSEYELLRNEIVECYDTIKQYNLAAYATVVAIFAFATEQSDSFLYYLIPYVAIIPLYIACESKNHNICKIAAYMYVFLEGDNKYNWERRHQKYDELFSQKRNWRSISLYYFLSILCSIMSIVKIYMLNYNLHIKLLFSILVFVFTIVVIVIMKANTINYVDCRKTMIENWENINKSVD